MSICDFLFSADMLVPKPREAVAQMVETIGLPQPGPKAYVDYRESGWDCVFALVNKSWTVGPTRLEVIGPKMYPDTPSYNRGFSISDVQGKKPCKTHATVMATPEIDRLAEHVKSLGLRHWFEEGGTEQVPFSRLWMGLSPERENDYEPEADAGLVVEVIPSDSVAFTPKLFQTPAPEPIDPHPGQMIRILSRAFIVDDLDSALRTIEANLLWEAAGPIIEDKKAGYRFAIMSRNYDQGATLKLVQPLDSDNAAGEYYKTWGGGPFTIRVAVHDLAAKREFLKEKGTGFIHLATTGYEPERVLVDSAATALMPFEFVEYGTTTA